MESLNIIVVVISIILSGVGAGVAATWAVSRKINEGLSREAQIREDQRKEVAAMLRDQRDQITRSIHEQLKPVQETIAHLIKISAELSERHGRLEERTLTHREEIASLKQEVQKVAGART